MSTEYKLKSGNTLKLIQDDNVESPREWDNVTQMIFFGKHEHLGDKHNVKINNQYNSRWDFVDNAPDEIRKQIKDIVAILPVHYYEHSGCAISTSSSYPFNCRWDSGTIGFCVVTKKALRECFGVKKLKQEHLDKAESYILGEVETLNQWLEGDVYGFRIETPEGEHVDSCWGFYGHDIKTNGMLDHIDDEIVDN